MKIIESNEHLRCNSLKLLAMLFLLCDAIFKYILIKIIEQIDLYVIKQKKTRLYFLITLHHFTLNKHELEYIFFKCF